MLTTSADAVIAQVRAHRIREGIELAGLVRGTERGADLTNRALEQRSSLARDRQQDAAAILAGRATNEAAAAQTREQVARGRLVHRHLRADLRERHVPPAARREREEEA